VAGFCLCGKVTVYGIDGKTQLPVCIAQSTPEKEEMPAAAIREW